MKAGDLVQVRPAKAGAYLIVRKILPGDKDYPRYRGESDEGPMWLLFGDDIGCAPMNEVWMDVVSEY